MKRVVLVVLSFLLCGCQTLNYIPSKHFISLQNGSINDTQYQYYDKFINNKIQTIYRVDDEYALINLFKDDLVEKEVYFEINDALKLEKIFVMLRALYAQRIRLFHGTTNDFAMIKVEYSNRENEALVYNKTLALKETLINDEMSDFEKIQIVHDYIVANTLYSSDYDSENTTAFEAYGVLYDKSAVCEGYARSFQLFMQLLDIPCIIIESIAMNHAFNYVLVDDEWKFIDLTFDDPLPNTPKIYCTYFLLNEDELLKEKMHSFDDEQSSGMSFEEYKRLVNNINWKN